MERLRKKIRVTFRAKVLGPIITVMVLVVVSSMWLVSRRITSQLQADAAQQLTAAEDVFKNSQQIRANNLVLRYRNVVNEPRLKAVSSVADQNTFLHLLDDLIGEGVADAILLTTDKGQRLAIAAHDPRVDLTAFEADCRPAIAAALGENQPKVGEAQIGDDLFDVVAVPIHLGGSVVGVMSFCVENSLAQEFNQLTHSKLVLISNGRVVASSASDLLPPMARPRCAASASAHTISRFATGKCRV